MGLQFEQDAWSNLRLLPAPILTDSPAFPLTASIHLSDIQFDETLVAVLLQACIGGSANYYRVQKLTSFCFLFYTPSIASMQLLLRQPPIKTKTFTLIFDHILCSPARHLFRQTPASQQQTPPTPSMTNASTVIFQGRTHAPPPRPLNYATSLPSNETASSTSPLQRLQGTYKG
jgi:hypothetical protein